MIRIIILGVLFTLPLFGCAYHSPYSPKRKLQEPNIRALVEQYIQNKKSWKDFTITDIRFDESDDAWIALVWRHPEVYGGHIILMVSTEGEVLKEIPGY